MIVPGNTQSVALGVNIDHVATLRQQRLRDYPDPIQAALLAEDAGADLITLHLREDRRHIQDADLARLRTRLRTRMNLECAITPDMLAMACQTHPEDVCLVPERRQELTTEGGLDVVGRQDAVRAAIGQLHDAGIRVSLFIDPELMQVQAAHACGATVIELHTGAYADAQHPDAVARELERIRAAITTGLGLGLQVNAGHGLHYENVSAIAALPGIAELNIGHAIVARAVFDGLTKAVADMKALIVRACCHLSQG